MRILCYGDSNTWGYNPENATRYQHRWTRELARLLPDDEIIEEGLNGRTFRNDDPEWPGRNGIEILPVLLRTHRPLDLVIVMLGSNDLKSVFHMTGEKLAEGLGETIHTIQKETLAVPYSIPEVLVLSPALLGNEITTTSMWSPYFDENSLALSRETSSLFETVSREKKTFFFDVSPIVNSSEKDSLHLDEESHIRLAEALSVEINSIKEKMMVK